MISLTAAQAEALAFIESNIAENGVAPSFQEIQEHCGLKSKSGVHRLITALVERGRIRRMENRARAIEIVRASDNPLTDYSTGALVAELARRHSDNRKAA